MKITNLPYFVKFIFSSDNDLCFKTSKFDDLQFIIDDTTNERINNLYIRQRIRIIQDDNNENSYEIYDIKIRHLFDDTDYHRYE